MSFFAHKNMRYISILDCREPWCSKIVTNHGQFLSEAEAGMRMRQ